MGNEPVEHSIERNALHEAWRRNLSSSLVQALTYLDQARGWGAKVDGLSGDDSVTRAIHLAESAIEGIINDKKLPAGRQSKWVTL